MWGDGQPLRATTNVALSSNAEIRGVFGALARVVLLWGNGPFPGGSIGERVLRGPARKGPTAPQREGWGTPAPATPSIATIVLLFTLLPLPRLCPGHCRGCAVSHAAAFPAQPNHTHTGGKRAGATRGPLPVTATPSLPLFRLTNLLSQGGFLPRPHPNPPPGCRGRPRWRAPVCDWCTVGSCRVVPLAGVRGGG